MNLDAKIHTAEDRINNLSSKNSSQKEIERNSQDSRVMDRFARSYTSDDSSRVNSYSTFGTSMKYATYSRAQGRGLDQN